MDEKKRREEAEVPEEEYSGAECLSESELGAHAGVPEGSVADKKIKKGEVTVETESAEATEETGTAEAGVSSADVASGRTGEPGARIGGEVGKGIGPETPTEAEKEASESEEERKQ